MKITCPKCKYEFDASSQFAAVGGAASSQRKAAAARRNGKKGGRPKAKQNPRRVISSTWSTTDFAALARVYKAETIRAVEAHIKAQLDPARELSAPPAVGQGEQ